MANLKLYVHYEEVGMPEYTKVVRFGAASDNGHAGPVLVSDLVASFASSYNEKHGRERTALAAVGLRVFDAKGKEVKQAARLLKTFSNLADVFIRRSPECAEPMPPEANASRSVNASISGGSATDAAVLPGQGSSMKSSTSATSGVVQQQQQKHASSMKSGTSDSPPVATPIEAVRTMQPAAQIQAALLPHLEKADFAVKSQNYRTAKDIYERLHQMLPHDPQIMLKLAETWLIAGKPAKAAEWAQRSVDCSSGDSTSHELLAMALHKKGDDTASMGQYQLALSSCRRASEGGERERHLQLGMAQAMYASKDRVKQDLAANLVMELLQQDEENWDCLFMYSHIALDRGMRQDAIRVILRLVVKRSSDAAARKLLAECLTDADAGIEELLSELHTGESSPAALAFIATCVKDHGAVSAAIQLLRKAHNLDPLHSSYTLNLLHALELEQQFDEVVELTGAFCKATKLTLGGGLRLQDINAVLSDLQPLGNLAQQSWQQAADWQPEGSEAAGAEDSNKVAYSGDELDLLAILFTLVKVLYTGGAVAHAARLCRLIEPARRASSVELHTTLIRNEAAYFGCVLQLINTFPPPALDCSAHDPPLAPLYLLGDSHCLSPAWRHVVLRGEPRLLHPLLVTGCKLWHLRPESRFYPKLQFLNVVAKLPDNAQVLVMFGEIDCREGLLLAEQKLKYDSLEEGINHTVEIYVDVLLSLIVDRGCEIFVHPVAPVLNETRHIVKPFSKVLRRKMLEAAALPQAKSRLHYLDFFDKLLSSADSSRFNPDLAFDGTHMAPSYLKWMQESLNKVQAPDATRS